jgi:Protein of unknown function (DUF6044)/Bacterial membrane protein YfhO
MNVIRQKHIRLATTVNAINRVLLGTIAHWYTLIGVYSLLGLLTFPILEISIFGENAPQYTQDVFDDGAVSRLGQISSDWHQFGLALWNPYITTGNALLSQFAKTPIALDVILSLISSPFTAYFATYFLTVLFAGISMHLFLRDSLGLPNIVCLAGGIIYTFCFWSYSLSFVPQLLPMLFWMFDRASSSTHNSRKFLIGCIILTSFLFYNSHSQLTLLLAALQLAYILSCTPSRQEVLSRVRKWIYIWSLSILFYAPVLATQLVFLPESQRLIRDNTVWNPNLWSSIKTLIVQYSTVLFGLPAFRGLGASPGDYGTYYMGVFGVIMLTISSLVPRISRKQKFFLISLIGVPLFDFLALTLIQQIQRYLGFLNSFQFDRVRHFMPFILTANVAIAISFLPNIRWNELTTGLTRKALWLLIFLLIALQDLLSVRMFFLHTPYPFNNTPPIYGMSDPAKIGWTLSLIYTMTGTIICLFLVHKYKKMEIYENNFTMSHSYKMFLYAIVVFIFFDRLLYARVERLLDHSNLGTFQTSLGTTPALSFLESQTNSQTYRTLTFNDPDLPRIDHPNKMMFHRIYAADGYQNIYPLRYHELFGLLTAPYLVKHPDRYQYFHSWGNRAYAFGPDVNMTLANLIGIRWFYTRNIKLDSPQLVEVFNTGDERVYENTSVFPRAFVVSHVRAFSTREELLDRLSKATDQELRNQAYVLEDDISELKLPNPLKSTDGTATIRRYEPDQVILDVESISSSILVFSDVNMTGWACTINGEDSNIFSVDNAFRGVIIPAGHSRVVFRYVPWYTYAGVGLSLLALIITGLWYMMMGRRKVL